MTNFTSADILNIILSFVVLWVGIFLGWALWYVIMILRDTRSLTRATREKIEWAGDLVRDVRTKLDSSMTYMALVAKGIAEVMGYIRERRETKPTPKRRAKIVRTDTTTAP